MIFLSLCSECNCINGTHSKKETDFLKPVERFKKNSAKQAAKIWRPGGGGKREWRLFGDSLYFQQDEKKLLEHKKKKKQVNLVSQAALENPEHCSSIPVSTANQTQKQHLPLLVKGVCSYRCHMPFAFPTVQFQLVTCNDTRAVCWVTSHHADFYQQHADFYQLLDHWKHRCYNTHLETLAA